MKERPILFNAAMVRAILDGRKTQTRRVVKAPARNMQAQGSVVIQHREPGDKWYGNHVWSMRGKTGVWGDYTHGQFLSKCPYGVPGDQLWVKEPWKTERALDWLPPRDLRWGAAIYYLADGEPGNSARYRHARFMPRLFSRITLEITGVRVERLQGISEEDARGEGIERVGGAASVSPWRNYRIGRDGEMSLHCSAPTRSFMTLWESINGPGSWDANPWVWVIEFKRVEAPAKTEEVGL